MNSWVYGGAVYTDIRNQDRGWLEVIDRTGGIERAQRESNVVAEVNGKIGGHGRHGERNNYNWRGESVSASGGRAGRTEAKQRLAGGLLVDPWRRRARRGIDLGRVVPAAGLQGLRREGDPRPARRGGHQNLCADRTAPLRAVAAGAAVGGGPSVLQRCEGSKSRLHPCGVLKGGGGLGAAALPQPQDPRRVGSNREKKRRGQGRPHSRRPRWRRRRLGTAPWCAPPGS